MHSFVLKLDYFSLTSYFLQAYYVSGIFMGTGDQRSIVVFQSLSRVWLFVTPWTAALQASLSFTISQTLLKLTSIELVMPFDLPILCSPLPLFPLIFLSISVLSSELALHIRWPKDWSLSFRLSPSNDYSGFIYFRVDCLISLLSKGHSRVFRSTTIWKHQFFGTQPSLWSSSPIYMWLLEKP